MKLYLIFIVLAFLNIKIYGQKTQEKYFKKEFNGYLTEVSINLHKPIVFHFFSKKRPKNIHFHYIESELMLFDTLAQNIFYGYNYNSNLSELYNDISSSSWKASLPDFKKIRKRKRKYKYNRQVKYEMKSVRSHFIAYEYIKYGGGSDKGVWYDELNLHPDKVVSDYFPNWVVIRWL